MYQMVEKGICGGISQISHRHATLNQPAMNAYNPNEATRTLTYQDANPLGNVSTFTNEELPMDIPDDHHLGYILEVDLEYPGALRDSHNDYLLAPEHLDVAHDMLSLFQRKNFPKIRGCVRKRVPNLNDKEKYVVH